MDRRSLLKLPALGALAGLFSRSTAQAASTTPAEKTAVPAAVRTPVEAPPMGWNSFDSYGVYLHEEAAKANLEALARDFRPHGYDTFVVDNGWFGEYELVEGTNYTAKDVADTDSICSWCSYNYGVNMNHPGGQAFYDSLVDQMAGWGVDFIKFDDITAYPKEILGVARAIEKSGRDIVLSFSPGDDTRFFNMPYYRRANMLRTTSDIWDRADDLNQAFDAWNIYQGTNAESFFPDLDMIPFGKLMVMSPKKYFDEESSDTVNLSGKGNTRMDRLTEPQKRTFITMRALAGSPLFIGGDLPTMDDVSTRLLTNEDMLACDQNGVAGSKVYEEGDVEVWMTPQQEPPGKGWMGLFNRSDTAQEVSLSKRDVKLDGPYSLRPDDETEVAIRDVWQDRSLPSDRSALSLRLEGNDVAFLRFEWLHNNGGYLMPPAWVNAVQRTQTAHLLDPPDPTPVKNDIGVYYTDFVYGRVSFALVEDRKWKSGPDGLVPAHPGRPDHVKDPGYDPSELDVPAAKLLGERQLKFLDDWGADWQGADMKTVISQTVFAQVPTHHGPDYMYLVADLNSNGWPQTQRDAAVRRLRKAVAFHIGGDQHLPMLLQCGLDNYDDGGYNFCVPPISNIYPRAFRPSEVAPELRHRFKGEIKETESTTQGPSPTGRYTDGIPTCE